MPNPLKRIIEMRGDAWLLARVDGWLESKPSGRSDPGWFHPSDLGHPCDAYLLFTYLGLARKEIVPARTRRIFDLGNNRDIAWKGYTVSTGLSLIKKEAERKILLPEYRIRGELDDIVKNPDTGEVFVVDYKTANDRYWQDLKGPNGGHCLQVHPYMYAKGISQALILYENKNDQAVKVFRVDFDNDLWKTITKRLAGIIQVAEKGWQPERKPIQNDSSCRYFWVCSDFDPAKFSLPEVASG